MREGAALVGVGRFCGGAGGNKVWVLFAEGDEGVAGFIAGVLTGVHSPFVRSSSSCAMNACDESGSESSRTAFAVLGDGRLLRLPYWALGGGTLSAANECTRSGASARCCASSPRCSCTMSRWMAARASTDSVDVDEIVTPSGSLEVSA